MTVAHTPTPYTAFVATTPAGEPHKPTLFQEFIDDATVPTPVGTPGTMRTKIDDAVVPGGTPTPSQLELTVIFPLALTAPQITAYDAVIAAHTATPDPDAAPSTVRTFTRTGEPTDNDDDDEDTGSSPRGGFRFGDEWHNDADGMVYRCVDATATAAVWELVTAFGSARASDVSSFLSVFDQTTPVAAGQVMITDGLGDIVLELRDFQSFANDPLSSTTSSTFVDRITQSPTIVGGDYVVTAYAEVAGANPEVQLLIDSVIEGFQAGAGTFAPHKVITLTAAAHDFELQWRKVSGGGTADITRARILIQKVKD